MVNITRITADTAETSIVVELETTNDGILSITTSDFLLRPFNDGNFFVFSRRRRSATSKFRK